MLWLPESTCTKLYYTILFTMPGVAMEALCSRTSAQTDDTIITCLKSVETLLTSKRESVVSPAISREILAVLHRLMLTRDNSAIRNLSIIVLEQLVMTAKTSTQCKSSIFIWLAISSGKLYLIDRFDYYCDIYFQSSKSYM